jgi:hypothetical protein
MLKILLKYYYIKKKVPEIIIAADFKIKLYLKEIKKP